MQAGRTLPAASYTRRARVGSRDIHDLVDVGAVLRLFDDGATIVLQGLHRYWPPVTALCRDLEHVLTHAVQANAYITPPGSQGLRVHADRHDVFALQTTGRKQWVVYEDGDEQAPTLDATLEPGDSLYVPRGTPHAARTVDEASVHLTIGISQLDWAGLLRRAVDQELAAEDFSAALPAGFAHAPGAVAAAAAAQLRELAARIEKADADALVAGAAQRFWSTRTPPLEGLLGQLLALDELTDDSVLARRAYASASLGHDRDGLVVTLVDRRLRMPLVAEPAVRRLLGSERTRVGDLGDVLDEPSRLVLARRLVREGLFVLDGD